MIIVDPTTRVGAICVICELFLQCIRLVYIRNVHLTSSKWNKSSVYIETNNFSDFKVFLLSFMRNCWIHSTTNIPNDNITIKILLKYGKFTGCQDKPGSYDLSTGLWILRGGLSSFRQICLNNLHYHYLLQFCHPKLLQVHRRHCKVEKKTNNMLSVVGDSERAYLKRVQMSRSVIYSSFLQKTGGVSFCERNMYLHMIIFVYLCRTTEDWYILFHIVSGNVNYIKSFQSWIILFLFYFIGKCYFGTWPPL